MADEEAKVLATAKKLALSERVQHKLWKVRSEAWEDIRAGCERAFSSSDPVLEETGPLFSTGVGDANANAMDKCLEAFCAWLAKADEVQAARCAPAVMSVMGAKCLKARPGTLAKATESCMYFVELEQQAVVVEAMLKALGDKVPKVVIAALDIILRAVTEFSAGVVDIKPVIKALPVVYGHSNAGVRDKAKELTVSLAAATGAAVVQATLVDKMSDAMKKDVESSISALPAGMKRPERVLRRHAAAQGVVEPTGDGSLGGNAAMTDDAAVAINVDAGVGEMDVYELADPVDVLSQLSKVTITVGDTTVPFWKCFESTKWNVRKGALDKIKELARVPRLEPGNYGDVCRELRKVLSKDANINCAASAAEATGVLAGGLRQDFGQYARQLAGPLMERFKEKNTSMSRAADEALRIMAQYCYGIGDVIDDILGSLAHKNPKVRLDALRLVRDMIDAAPKPQVTKSKDALLPSLVKLAPEADANIREAAQAALVALALKLGSFNAIQPALAKLDDSRSKMIEQAVIAAANAGPPPPAPTSLKSGRTAPSKPLASRPTAAMEQPGPHALSTKNPNLASVIGQKPSNKPPGVARAPPRAAATATTGRATTSSYSAEDDASPVTSGRLNPEEAEERLVGAIGAELVEELRSPQWQARLQAMNAVVEKATATAGDPSSATLVLCLAHLPGWNEKNFQVLNKVLETVTLLARECPGFDRVHASVCVEGAGDRLHELKHRIQASDALVAMAEAVGPRFVAAQLHARAAANKTPKALSEALVWLATAVDDFGLVALDLPALLSWMIADLGSPNAPIRTQAMKVLGRCHAQVGAGLLPQLTESLKPAQLTALEEILEKNPRDPEYRPTKFFRKNKTAGLVSLQGDVAGGAGASIAPAGAHVEAPNVHRGDAEAVIAHDTVPPQINLDDLLPRVDISSSLTSSLTARLSSANWKERNAALEEIEGLLSEAGGRITPDIPVDLFLQLRGRFGDTNRNLAARALLLLAKLADAVGGPAFDRLARQAVLAPALATLSDNKKQVREAVVTLLDSWIPACPLERLFGPIADALMAPKLSSEGRVSALGWGCTTLQGGKGSTETGFAQAVLRCVAAAAPDKSGAVRDAGGQLLAALVARVGAEEVVRSLNGLDNKTRAAVEPLVSKATCMAGVGQASRGSMTSLSRTASSAAASPTNSGPSRPSSDSREASLAATGAVRPSSLTLAKEKERPPILSVNSSKAVRSRLFRARPARFEAPSADELEVVEAGLTGIASEEFYSLLFSKDFKDHVNAANQLVEALPELLPEIISSLDLLLRWAVVRICEGNPQALIRILETIKAVLEALAVDGYRLHESEAAILLPAIVERSGSNQDRVRARHRDVLRAACGVCATPRVLDYIAVGLTSKNARTRVECCEEIACIAGREGIGPLVASKSRPMSVVATLLKERDGSLRAAALCAIEEAWVQGGTDMIWTLLGRVDAREKSIIQDRLRRCGRETAADEVHDQDQEEEQPAVQPEVGYGAARLHAPSNDYSHRPTFTPPNALDITPENAYGDGMLRGGGGGGGGMDNMGTGYPSETPSRSASFSSNGIAATPVPGASRSRHATSDDEADAFEKRWMDDLRIMAGTSLPDAINATKQLCAEIMAVADQNPGSQPPSEAILAIMAASTERMLSIVMSLLRDIFEDAEQQASQGMEPSSRGCKFALNVMLQGMGVPEIAMSVPQGSLREAIALMLARLVDDRGLMVFKDGPTLVRAVNVLVAKMLDATNRNYSFAALLQLLRAPPSGLEAKYVAKFNDLVVKCLIKLTKALQATGGTVGVDVSTLLFNLHDFFMFLGVEEIRRRSSADDKPLRMVKTILHELCKMEGHGIYEYAAGIPGRNANPQPIVFAYIQMNLTSLEASGMLQPAPLPHTSPRGTGFASSAAGEGAGRYATSDVPMLPAESEGPAIPTSDAVEKAAKAEVKQRLKDAMTQLSQKDQAAKEAALVELVRLKRAHPQFVEKYINGTSELFRRHIDEGMARIEAQGIADASEHGGAMQGVMSPATSERSVSSPGIVTRSMGNLHAQDDALAPQSLRSEGSQSSKLSSYRERLDMLRREEVSSSPMRSPSLSKDFAGQGRGDRQSPRLIVGQPTAGGSASAAGASHLSVEQLSSRLARLRKL